MKYLEDMSDEELLMIAKRERILLSLKFLRNELINNLETKGYPKKDPVKAAEEQEEIEKERNRPKRSEIRITPDGSVEVVEIPIENEEIQETEKLPEIEEIEEIEEIPEILEINEKQETEEYKKVQIQENEYLQETHNNENSELAKEIVKEIDRKVKNNDDIKKVPSLTPEDVKTSEIKSTEEKLEEKAVSPVNEEKVNVNKTSNEKISDSVAEEKAAAENSIRIVILNQNEAQTENNYKSRKVRKSHRNYISRKSSKVLRGRRHNIFELKSKLDLYPMGLDENLINRRKKERKIQNSKYIVGTEKTDNKEPGKDRFFDRNPLPSAYFVDEIVLMPKNNHTLFAYWEIREDTYNKLREEKHVSSDVVIKVYKNGVEDKRVIRSERLGSHYIHDIEANQNYDVSIGYENKDGEYIEIAHSSKALSPRTEPSESKDVKWLEVDKEFIKKEVEENKEINEDDNYIDEEIFSVLLNKLRNVRSS